MPFAVAGENIALIGTNTVIFEPFPGSGVGYRQNRLFSVVFQPKDRGERAD
jgi:hypothetical protein